MLLLAPSGSTLDAAAELFWAIDVSAREQVVKPDPVISEYEFLLEQIIDCEVLYSQDPFDNPNPLTSEDAAAVQAVLEGRVAEDEISITAKFYLMSEDQKTRAADPYGHSELPSLLALETWEPKDALLILAGISPLAAHVDWSYANYLNVTVHSPRVNAATCFTDVFDHYDVLNLDDLTSEIRKVRSTQNALNGKKVNGSATTQVRNHLEILESLSKSETVLQRAKLLELRSEVLAILYSRWENGAHDAGARRPPSYYVSWAEKRGFTIEWAGWAREKNLLDDGHDVFRAPHFDADKPDYPEYLVIANRAWEYARVNGEGTPKQRVLKFLMERYPNVPADTRDAIARVVNWRRTGGRPPKT